MQPSFAVHGSVTILRFCPFLHAFPSFFARLTFLSSSNRSNIHRVPEQKVRHAPVAGELVDRIA